MVDKQTSPSRFIRGVLVVSLALNLAVAGLFIGSLVSGRMGDGPPRSFDLGLGPIARALSPEDRRAVAVALRRSRPMGDFDLRGQIERMIETVRAEQFEPDVLRALMAEQNGRIADLQRRAQDVLIDHIATMSVSARNAFADRLVAEQSRMRDRFSRDSDK